LFGAVPQHTKYVLKLHNLYNHACKYFLFLVYENICVILYFSLSLLFNKNVRDSFGEGLRGTNEVERGVRGTREVENPCFKQYRTVMPHRHFNTKLRVFLCSVIDIVIFICEILKSFQKEITIGNFQIITPFPQVSTIQPSEYVDTADTLVSGSEAEV
jgi:hypothetical protein